MKQGNTVKRIPITKPLFDKNEERAVVEVVRSGWVIQGPKVAEFEQLIADYIGTKYAVATSSATTALFLSLYIHGVGRGDEIIVPSFSFIATANVIVHVGAKPIFVDIDPRTYNLDPEKVEKAITKRTKGIIAVDQVGLPCDLDEIRKIVKDHKLFVVEDAACALGSEYKGKRIGSITEPTCFSFHPRKLITTGDGGVITTNDRKFAERAEILRNQGMGISSVARHKAIKLIYESYPEIGFNFRMSDLEAAVGVEQIKKLPRILAARKRLAERYNKAFSKSRLVIPPYVPEGYIHNWQTYVVRLKRNKKITRDGLMQKLLDKGIATRRGVMAVHLEAPYRKLVGRVYLPETENVAEETFLLPLYPQLASVEQDYIINQVLKATEL